MGQAILYLFQVHVSSSSPIPDHCTTYALSDAKESCFASTCDHQHDESCTECDNLVNALQDVQDQLTGHQITIDNDELVDLRYVAKEAAQNIISWKAHQL